MISLHVSPKLVAELFAAGVATSFAESVFSYSLYDYVKAGVLYLVHLVHKPKTAVPKA